MTKDAFYQLKNDLKLSNDALYTLSRDLNVEVGLVEEGGKRILTTGSSASNIADLKGLTPNASKVIHTQPTNGILSPTDIATFKRVTNSDAKFIILVEREGGLRPFTYTQSEIQDLAKITDQTRQRARAVEMANQKAKSLGLKTGWSVK